LVLDVGGGGDGVVGEYIGEVLVVVGVCVVVGWWCCVCSCCCVGIVY